MWNDSDEKLNVNNNKNFFGENNKSKNKKKREKRKKVIGNNETKNEFNQILKALKNILMNKILIIKLMIIIII